MMWNISSVTDQHQCNRFSASLRKLGCHFEMS